MPSTTRIAYFKWTLVCGIVAMALGIVGNGTISSIFAILPTLVNMVTPSVISGSIYMVVAMVVFVFFTGIETLVEEPRR